MTGGLDVFVTCTDDERRRRVAEAASAFNGIDFVEVEPADQRVLRVGFLHPLPSQAGGVPAAPPLGPANVVVEGGERVTGIEVVGATAAAGVLTVTVDVAGDFSPYRLRIVRSAVDHRPPEGFDPALSTSVFSFKVNCPSDLDCAEPERLSVPLDAVPLLDYLGKDYEGFRRLLLDRMATLAPGTTDGHPADPLVAVVETLAHIADRLSYRQDAVATEAYLGTARSRLSVRRHARLLDYTVHDGCTARTWVRVEVLPGSSAEANGIPAGTPVVSGPPGEAVVAPDQLDQVLAGGAAFETLDRLSPLAARNRIAIHDWSGRSCHLPAGTTRTTLVDDPPLGLGPGDLLLFEEVADPVSGRVADADPAHRQVVRITSAEPASDPVEGVALLDVTWGPQDALRFPLVVKAIVAGEGTGVEVTCGVARGNVVLAHHAVAVRGDLPPVPFAPRWRPLLTTGGVACAEPPPSGGPAAGVLVQDPRAALPLVQLDSGSAIWEPRRDLLASDRFDHGFVVERERDGRSTLRFGDDIHGRRPIEGTVFQATWRAGGGPAGKVGNDVLSSLVTSLDGVTLVTNPLPAQGGTAAEGLEDVRQHAPSAFLTQERAVTEADWGEVARRQPDVQDAAARFRWTGSWWTLFLTLDLAGGARLADEPELERRLTALLDRYRIAGYDLELTDPVDVDVDLTLHVCVAPGSFRADVRRALLDAFSNRDVPGVGRGFFHPDEHSFGQPLYVSRIVARAMAVPGVATVTVTELHPVGAPQREELVAGLLAVGDLEVVRLDNDPNFPEHGILRLDVEGGQ